MKIENNIIAAALAEYFSWCELVSAEVDSNIQRLNQTGGLSVILEFFDLKITRSVVQ